MKYKLERMGGERAKKILQSLLNELSGIEEEDMTTFELNMLRKCATNPPKRYYGSRHLNCWVLGEDRKSNQ